MSTRHVSDGGGGISRRETLRLGLAGAAGLMLTDGLGSAALAAEATSAPAPKPASAQVKAKSVIQIFLWGGMSHNDTWDPKPEAGRDYMGEFMSVVPTNVDGIRIGALFPELAKQADKYSLIRSMTHRNNMVQTAREPGGRDVYPCAGAVVSLFKGYNAGYEGLIPPYIVVTQPQGRFSEAGFLGTRFKPFATGGDQESFCCGRDYRGRGHRQTAAGTPRIAWPIGRAGEGHARQSAFRTV